MIWFDLIGLKKIKDIIVFIMFFVKEQTHVLDLSNFRRFLIYFVIISF